MSRFEALPADQKSVLQLLLRQGKGYDDLSTLLHLDADEVRSRAHDALDALGPGAAGLPSGRRQEIGDWLLGQQDPDKAAATQAFLEESAAGRSWARAVAGELEPVANGRMPEIPEGAGDAAPAATPISPAPTAAPRVSRRGGALLIGGIVAAAAIAVVLVLVFTGGDDNKGKDTATNAASTTSTQAQPKVQAQVNLTPPADGPAKKALAIVQVVDANGQEAVNAVSQGLPAPKKAAYAIWVYSSPSQTKLIGGFDKTDNKGHLVYQGSLPQGFDITAYREILVTKETSGNPKRPGTIYLRGSISGS